MYYALSRCVDDAGVDYTSLLDTEQRRARLTNAKNICNLSQKYLLRSGSARSCWTRRCGRAWRWARCTASCSATSTAGTDPRCPPRHPHLPTLNSEQYNGEICPDPSRLLVLFNAVLSSFGFFVSMNMEAVIIRVCYIQKMPGFMTMESLSYGNKTEAAEF